MIRGKQVIGSSVPGVPDAQSPNASGSDSYSISGAECGKMGVWRNGGSHAGDWEGAGREVGGIEREVFAARG